MSINYVRECAWQDTPFGITRNSRNAVRIVIDDYDPIRNIFPIPVTENIKVNRLD